MTANLRNILKLSLSLRKSKFLFSLPSSSFHSSPLLEARFNRPVLTSEQKSPERALDILEGLETPEKPESITQRLRKCRTQQEVLQLIPDSSNLSAFQALKFLEMLFQMDKNRSDKNVTDVIYQKKEFADLCDILKKHIRQLSTKQSIDALKYMTYFNVPSSTVIVQMLLQMIRTSVNQLTLDEILFVSFLLKKCQKTPLVEALDIALPIVFETQVKTQLDSNNLEALVKILQYLRQLGINSDVVSRILKIFEMKYSEEISPVQAKQILFCLLDWECNETVKSLLPKMFEIMSGGMEEFNEVELKALLRRIMKNFQVL